MRLYIDPGTGSMLFAILIGVIGALNFLLKNWIVKLRFILSGGKKVETNTDRSRWSSFRTTNGIGAFLNRCAGSLTNGERMLSI